MPNNILRLIVMKSGNPASIGQTSRNFKKVRNTINFYKSKIHNLSSNFRDWLKSKNIVQPLNDTLLEKFVEIFLNSNFDGKLNIYTGDFVYIHWDTKDDELYEFTSLYQVYRSNRKNEMSFTKKMLPKYARDEIKQNPIFYDNIIKKYVISKKENIKDPRKMPPARLFEGYHIPMYWIDDWGESINWGTIKKVIEYHNKKTLDALNSHEQRNYYKQLKKGDVNLIRELYELGKNYHQ